jgi:hypothetical protein
MKDRELTFKVRGVAKGEGDTSREEEGEAEVEEEEDTEEEGAFITLLILLSLVVFIEVVFDVEYECGTNVLYAVADCKPGGLKGNGELAVNIEGRLKKGGETDWELVSGRDEIVVGMLVVVESIDEEDEGEDEGAKASVLG